MKNLTALLHPKTDPSLFIGKRVRYRAHIGDWMIGNGCVNHRDEGILTEYPIPGETGKIGVAWDKGGKSNTYLWNLELLEELKL